MVIIPFLNNCFSLTKKLVCSSAIHCASHIRFGMCFKIPEMPIYFNVFETLQEYMNSLLDTDADDRIEKNGLALFYTYVWGWYTLLIEMPHYSVQGLLANPPALSGILGNQVIGGMQTNQEELQRYLLLASLFADENDEEFETKNFGYLTPQEALEEYTKSYDSRFNGYLGRALGRFITLIPNDRYR